MNKPKKNFYKKKKYTQFSLLVGLMVLAFVFLVGMTAIRWNNGICRSCGGKKIFTDANGKDDTTYYYTCEKCGESTFYFLWPEFFTTKGN